MCLFWGKKTKNNSCEDETGLVKLVTVHNSYELGIAESILKDNRIPYIVQEEGGGGLLKLATGALLTDADIMVEKSDLQKAKDLVYMVINEAYDEDEENW